ncbi:DUF262 domain-containing protein [Flavobacterium selenitireducens]|uniref:DUF262 domain-containing protein n=1 Tax=Flavobacterium selenitireducens TaxID=2722704 RepID=UPI00168BD037|nr:DUF262 domain-containing protein [Flavobacterium selenitireducens]MBD3584029.1 DUF262 domain-containing protein [Flavobacterium selenitireducens]
MGHIANKIDAKDKKLSEVLSGQRYRIDSFQREYRWQRKQIESLISDLSISFKKNHNEGHLIKNANDYDCYYMGPIVLCDTNNELSIVDGQQRLTSFTLLLIYLLHEQEKLKEDNLILRDLKPYLYVTKSGEVSFVLNVKTRNKVLSHLIENPSTIFEDAEELESNLELDFDDSIKVKKNDESINNLIERYEDITLLFPEEFKTKNVLPIFIEWILEKVVLVEVKAYSLENAYTIFETMNDRGLTLNPTEILKAFLLHKIDDDDKSDEANDFWKEKIFDIKSKIGSESELDFFRAWLRAKYAETRRDTKQGAENEDFEQIGTQFHTWVKNNSDKIYLNTSEDYYYFIKSDFDFYSNLYIAINSFKNHWIPNFETLYISNFYPIADSLSYPLVISPISKADSNMEIDEKINVVARFLDIYTIKRVLVGRAITQSTIRNNIYELIKSTRNQNIESIQLRFRSELDKLSKTSPFILLHRMDNWGFYHYIFARIMYANNNRDDFSSLLRNRKQSSYILYKYFENEDKPASFSETNWNLCINSVAGHCLVRRHELEKIHSKKGVKRLQYLIKQGYLQGTVDNEDEIEDFIIYRDEIIRQQIDALVKY